MNLSRSALLLLLTYSSVCFSQEEDSSDEKAEMEIFTMADVSCFSGIWLPTGNAKLLGPHPIVGVKVGAVKKRFDFGALIEFRFIRSANTYQINYNNNTVSTHNFLGGLLSVYLNYDIAKLSNSEIYVIGGFGWDGFDAIEKDPPTYPKSITINSFNYNLGIGGRFHFSKKSKSPYIGTELIYNFIDYENPKGTSIDGNTITIRLMYGSIFYWIK